MFTQLSLKEREKLYIWNIRGKSIRKIAQELCRAPSTISRELRRNQCNDSVGYLPDRAQITSRKRKYKLEPKLERWPKLKKHVIAKLKDYWSPEIIAGRLKVSSKLSCRISSEAIYQFIYNDEGQRRQLYKLLAKSRPRRGMRGGRKPRGIPIPNRISIHNRPMIIETRKELGHFEGDLTFFTGNQSENIAVILERKSRFVLLKKNESKRTNDVMSGIFNMLAQLPNNKRKSITFDNGKEFTKHGLLKDHLNMHTFFCDKHAPWQKGQVENFNAFLHRFIPKNTALKYFTDTLIQKIQNKINQRPRKCLGFKTPSEVFQEILC